MYFGFLAPKLPMRIDGLRDSLNGKSHAEIADALEDAGYVVRMDPHNNCRSEVIMTGCCNQDGSDVVIAEIRGDDEAKIV